MISAFLLTACPQEWHVSLETVENPLSPQFCVSEQPRCSGGGVRLTDFFVAAVDDTGKYTRDGTITELMWMIVPAENEPLHRLTYGRVPDGWRETSPSRSLTTGRWYTVGTHYFRLKQVGGEVEAEMLSDEEFQEQFVRGQEKE